MQSTFYHDIQIMLAYQECNYGKNYAMLTQKSHYTLYLGYLNITKNIAEQRLSYTSLCVHCTYINIYSSVKVVKSV